MAMNDVNDRHDTTLLENNEIETGMLIRFSQQADVTWLVLNESNDEGQLKVAALDDGSVAVIEEEDDVYLVTNDVILTPMD
jgi:hypothetical protein